MKLCYILPHLWYYYSEMQRWPAPEDLQHIYGPYFDPMPINIRECRWCGKKQQRLSHIYEWVRHLPEFKIDAEVPKTFQKSVLMPNGEVVTTTETYK